MKVKLAGHLENANGKFSTGVYYKTRSGLIMRNYVKPNNPQTAEQMATRAAQTAGVAAWQALTDEQRAAWDNYAPEYNHTNPVGDSALTTGYNVFMKFAQNTALVGAPIVTVPPFGAPNPHAVATIGGTLTVMGSTITAFSLNLTLAGGAALGVDDKLYVRMTPPRSGAESLATVERYEVAINRGAPYNTLTPDVLAKYSARIGTTMGAGQKIGVAIKIVDSTTGRTTQYTRFLMKQGVNLARKVTPSNNGHKPKTNGNGNGHRAKGNGNTMRIRRNGHRRLVAK